MHRIDESEFVRQQYRDSAKLRARIELHRRFSTNSQDLPRWILEQLDLPANARVLELGCGPGSLWSANADRIPPGWDVTLSDLSAGMVDEAHANMRDVAGRLSFRVADAQDLPFEDARFDAVLAMHMLYHVPDRERAYGEVGRVLRPGGSLYAVTNGRTNMRELHDLAAELGLESRWYSGSEGPFQLETAQPELERHFARVERRDYPDGLLITEAAPLVDYLLSMDNADRFVARRAELIDRVNAILGSRGSITVTKSVGMLIAGDYRSANEPE